MIITNWRIHNFQGVRRISGKAIDNVTSPDGSDILTSAVHYTDGNALVTKSGSRYYLGAANPEQDVAELDQLRAALIPTTEQTDQPFKAAIENWTGMNTLNGPVLMGQAYGLEGYPDGSDIKTSPIKAKDGTFFVTASGSRYALGTPTDGIPLDAKARLLGALPDAPTEAHIGLENNHS